MAFCVLQLLVEVIISGAPAKAAFFKVGCARQNSSMVVSSLGGPSFGREEKAMSRKKRLQKRLHRMVGAALGGLHAKIAAVSCTTSSGPKEPSAREPARAMRSKVGVYSVGRLGRRSLQE